MRASEARSKAIIVMDRSDIYKQEMNRIYKSIDEAARSGKLRLNIEIRYSFHDYVNIKLSENGYKYGIVFEKYEIKW